MISAKAIWARIKKLIRWFIRAHEREIKEMANEVVDKALKQLTKEIYDKMPADLKARVRDRIIADKIDIASTDGKMWINAIVNKYIDEAQKGE
jgi:hypothetical protein